MNITVHSGPRLVPATQLKTMLLCVLSAWSKERIKKPDSSEEDKFWSVGIPICKSEEETT